MKAHRACVEDRGQALDGSVVRLDPLVEAHPLDRDAVFRAGQLGLQIPKVIVGAQFGVALHHDQQPRESGRKLALGFIEFLQLGGVRGGLIGVYLNLPNRSPRLRDLGESRFLEIGCPGDRLHKIGNQIGAALVLALHLGPFGIDRLGEPDQVVVAPATAHEEDDAEENQNSRATESIFLHAPSKHSIAAKRNNNFFANL